MRSESVNKFQYAQLLRSIFNEAEKLNKKVDDIIKFVKNHVVEIQKTEQQSDTSRSDVYVSEKLIYGQSVISHFAVNVYYSGRGMDGAGACTRSTG